MFSRCLLSFLFGLVLLISLSFATPPPTPNYINKNVVVKSHVDQFPTYFDSSIAKLSQGLPPAPEPWPVPEPKPELIELEVVKPLKLHEPDFLDIRPNGQQTTKNYKSVFENSHNSKTMLTEANRNSIKVANLRDQSIHSQKLQQPPIDDLVKTQLFYKPHF